MGVFLLQIKHWSVQYSLPHARGGVSTGTTGGVSGKGSSPRPWGCFITGATQTNPVKSSPRPWGCFRVFVDTETETETEVFPTPVGVFLQIRAGANFNFGLPHARGGVSTRPDQ